MSCSFFVSRVYLFLFFLYLPPPSLKESGIKGLLARTMRCTNENRRERLHEGIDDCVQRSLVLQLTFSEPFSDKNDRRASFIGSANTRARARYIAQLNQTNRVTELHFR